jgi:hypothetical protein
MVRALPAAAALGPLDYAPLDGMTSLLAAGRAKQGACRPQNPAPLMLLRHSRTFRGDFAIVNRSHKN